ncbi:hypothetical protein [Methanobrevibacter filiformis]|uniref:Chromosome partition protein Smc n=1 Tax=Methanobrevibacter filiformis TaxID=55758 RepID=A0A166FEJ1_9EURY|nr:hypothetical protein [Methanobrevibacter filiformis]KZX17594.1 hypothetical protein MBFIL_00790 [Methanobrevibacter filiformis]
MSVNEEDSDLIEKLELEVESLKNKLNKERKDYSEKITFLESKVSRLIFEKKELNEEIRLLELKEFDLKIKKLERIQQKLYKSEHKVDVVKKHLTKSHKDIELLKEYNNDLREDLDNRKNDIFLLEQIIKEYPYLGIFNYIRDKKPNSYYKYFKYLKD